MIHDQAAGLREKVDIDRGLKNTKIITVTSGKGGVGKSNFTLNFALALLESGHRTAIMDADIGLANIDVLMGIAPKHSLLDVLNNSLTIWDIMEKGPNNLLFIPGGSDLQSMFDLKRSNLPYLFDQLSLLNGHIDTLLIDTGAGISPESLKFILSSDEVFLITTPEPTSITDAYAMLKIIHTKNNSIKINLIINQVVSEREGKGTSERFRVAAERFLDYQVNIYGYIPQDDNISKAVKKQEPFYLSYPNSKASKSIRLLVDKYTNNKNELDVRGVSTFLEQVSNWFHR